MLFARPKSSLTFLFLALAFVCLSGFGSESSVEIRKFRFAKHKPTDFERLVVEFKKHGQTGEPTLVLTPEPSGTQVLVGIDRINLSGVIPEAAINDSYVTRSQYLGPISINTDDPTHPLAIRVFLKNNNLRVDAFYEGSPARLIVDAFPENSPRAIKGRQVLARVAPSRRPASMDDSKVICFPANAQLLASVQFVDVTNKQAPLRFDNINKGDGPVVCYPDTARVKAKVAFQLKPGALNQQSNADSGDLGDRAPNALGLGYPPSLGGPPPAMDALPVLPPPPPLPPLPGGSDDFAGRATGSTLNSNGFNPSTPLGSTLGDEGPSSPEADPSALLPPG